MLKPDVKRLWIEALRSGRYPQGRSFLNRDGRFCCLGVLCELAVEAGVVERNQGASVSYGTFNQGTLPPDVVLAWAGIDVLTGVSQLIMIGGVSTPLYGHNDTGRTFAQIADAIEEQL